MEKSTNAVIIEIQHSLLAIAAIMKFGVNPVSEYLMCRMNPCLDVRANEMINFLGTPYESDAQDSLKIIMGGELLNYLEKGYYNSPKINDIFEADKEISEAISLGKAAGFKVEATIL